ncbi:MAG: hypothetical protein Q7S60_00625 [bacterium]|nr:hypothetical protein [bacterium]
MMTGHEDQPEGGLRIIGEIVGGSVRPSSPRAYGLAMFVNALVNKGIDESHAPVCVVARELAPASHTAQRTASTRNSIEALGLAGLLPDRSIIESLSDRVRREQERILWDLKSLQEFLLFDFSFKRILAQVSLLTFGTRTGLDAQDEALKVFREYSSIKGQVDPRRVTVVLGLSNELAEAVGLEPLT